MGSRIDTQDRLIEATQRLIIEEGIEACSVENICKRAGFTRGAFYSNYATKNSLLIRVAEAAYGRVITQLDEVVTCWRSAAGDDNLNLSASSSMKRLIFEVFHTIGFDKELYILHSELTIRSIQDPEWGTRLLDVHAEFVNRLKLVFETILAVTGRVATVDTVSLTHAIIGIAMRAASVAAWRHAVDDYGIAQDGLRPSDAPASKETIDGEGMAHDVSDMILVLLDASSQVK